MKDDNRQSVQLLDAAEEIDFENTIPQVLKIPSRRF